MTTAVVRLGVALLLLTPERRPRATAPAESPWWESLESATRDAAAVLGAPSIRGTIEAGKLADLVVLRSDPLRDIRNTRAIQLVVKRGRVYQAGPQP